jgi:hypothetical protein
VILFANPPDAQGRFAFDRFALVIPRDGSLFMNYPLFATTAHPERDLQFLEAIARVNGFPPRTDNPAGGLLPDPGFVELSLQLEELM